MNLVIVLYIACKVLGKAVPYISDSVTEREFS